MSKLDFDATTNKYNLKNALMLCEASGTAYQSERKIKEHIKAEWGFDRFKFIDIGESQVFAAGNDAAIILAFRGTESIEDWLTDANVKFVRGPFGKVHKGFSQALEYVWNSVVCALHEFQDNNQSAWITGHSLGGALATLAVPKCAERKIKINGLYTFGQPRVGDEEFAEEFNKQFKQVSFRFVNNEDIVTRIPPSARGYDHIGQVVYFDSFGKPHKDIRWWNKFMDRSVSEAVRAIDRYGVLRNQFPDGLADHDIARYQGLIRRNLK